jgi:hypothetical protein
MEQLDPHRTDFHEIRCLSINRKSFEKIRVPLNRDKNNGTLLDVFTFMITPRWILLSMRGVSDNTVKKIKIRVSYSTTLLFRKPYRLWNNVEKCGGAREAADDKIIRRMSFARCVRLHTHTHTHTHTLPSLFLYRKSKNRKTETHNTLATHFQVQRIPV